MCFRLLDGYQNDRAIEWARVEGLKLVCALEWNCNPDEILKDFLKLVFVAAK
jgi:hypothetical protein